MAATAATFSDQQLESELKKLEKEISSDDGKLQETRRRLDTANAERSRIVEGITLGTVKDGELARIKADIEVLEIRVEGLNGLLASNRSKASVIQDELNARANAAHLVARQKALSELETRGKAAAIRITEKLVRIISEDIAEFDSIRQRLGIEFADLGGAAVAKRLRELVFKPVRLSDAAGVPDVHLQLLESRGWVHAETPGPSMKRIKTEQGIGPLNPNTFETVPGGPLHLIVISMRPQR